MSQVFVIWSSLVLCSSRPWAPSVVEWRGLNLLWWWYQITFLLVSITPQKIKSKAHSSIYNTCSRVCWKSVVWNTDSTLKALRFEPSLEFYLACLTVDILDTSRNNQARISPLVYVLGCVHLKLAPCTHNFIDTCFLHCLIACESWNHSWKGRVHTSSPLWLTILWPNPFCKFDQIMKTRSQRSLREL